MLCLGTAAFCIEYGRFASAEPESKEVKSSEFQVANPVSEKPSDPKPDSLPGVTIPTNDPLFQAILQELKGGDEAGNHRLASPNDNGMPEAERMKSKVVAPETSLCSQDWLAIELMLKSARLLASESEKRSSWNQSEAAQSRSEVAAVLRKAVLELIESSRPTRSKEGVLIPSLPRPVP